MTVLEQSTAVVPCNVPCTYASVNAPEWEWAVEDLSAAGATFLSLWGTDSWPGPERRFRVYAAFLTPGKLVVLEQVVQNPDTPIYPTISHAFPAALRMERAVRDLLGIASTAADQRGWLRHNGGWPEDVYPLRRDFDQQRQYAADPQPYPFVPVEGDGVHEIAVGPVHAGTIEPGHFRFSVVGEKVLRLEERLGYKHKGIEKRFEQMRALEGHRLAARISGDSAVAYSWAYCAALESITATEVPARAAHLRVLALEHERMANHLGDLGALGNDAGFALGLTHFSRLKEDLLRHNARYFGARYLMDYVIPGGVSRDFPEEERRMRLEHYLAVQQEVLRLRALYDNHGGVQDRFREAGKLSTELARSLGAVGLVARASGISQDLRVTHPWGPYRGIDTKLITESGGDVAARVQVRFDEVLESIRLCLATLQDLSHGPVRVNVPQPEPGSSGIGLIEGWRGPLIVALETGVDGTIRRCHTHDPSWQNWPLLEHAILGNIVPDFPLINKSFNLSYSGHDG